MVVHLGIYDKKHKLQAIIQADQDARWYKAIYADLGTKQT